MRKIVATEKAPAAIGPYAQANIVDGFEIGRAHV